jgi:hypothetical protein
MREQLRHDVKNCKLLIRKEEVVELIGIEPTTS